MISNKAMYLTPFQILRLSVCLFYVIMYTISTVLFLYCNISGGINTVLLMIILCSATNLLCISGVIRTQKETYKNVFKKNINEYILIGVINLIVKIITFACSHPCWFDEPPKYMISLPPLSPCYKSLKKFEVSLMIITSILTIINIILVIKYKEDEILIRRGYGRSSRTTFSGCDSISNTYINPTSAYDANTISLGNSYSVTMPQTYISEGRVKIST